MEKWTCIQKIHFSDDGVPVIKIAELNNGISGNTSYTKQIFSDDVHLKKKIYSFLGLEIRKHL